MQSEPHLAFPFPQTILAPRRPPRFRTGDHVRVKSRSPFGHYRVPPYLLGRIGLVDQIIEPAVIDIEAQVFGLRARLSHPHYRIAFLMCDVWPNYPGAPSDGLFIEVFEPWLDKVAT